MFRVLCNDKPAKYPEFLVDSSWDNCDFPTKEEAIEYSKKWMGIHLSPPNWDGSKIFYSGNYWASIEEIKEEPTSVMSNPFYVVTNTWKKDPIIAIFVGEQDARKFIDFLRSHVLEDEGRFVYYPVSTLELFKIIIDQYPNYFK